ncbi:MAG TPA: DUF6152 family protein [Gammaproteobacteria bacterium]|nr:DUF6152 family protein [Gammaproteobacteria bacterium]
MRALVLAVAAGCALTLPASAHHSHGNYIMTEYTTLQGTVTELHWVNPHIWIYLEVMDEASGEPTVWALEAAGASGLARRGIAKETVEPGDTISVRCHQLRDRSTGCLLGFLTTEGGEVVEWD